MYGCQVGAEFILKIVEKLCVIYFEMISTGSEKLDRFHFANAVFILFIFIFNAIFFKTN